MALRTYYEILGVSHDAVEGEIRRGYRRAVQEHHPDHNPSGAKSQKRIRELNTAHETLLNSALREKYDAKLRRAGLIPPEPAAEPEPAKAKEQSDSEELDISESDESVDAESVAEGFASQSFEPELESTTADWNTSSSNANRHKYSGEKRKQRFQLLVTLVMIPTGGIAGIAVAVLLLWVGFRLDPLGLFQVDGTPVASNSVDPIPSTDPLSRGSSVANTFGDPLKLNQSEPVAPKIILLYHSGDTDNQKEVASPRDGDVLGDPLNLNQTQPAQEEPPTTAPATEEEMQKFLDNLDENNQKKSSDTQGSDSPPIPIAIKPKPKEPTAPADQSSPEVPATTNSFGMSFAKLEFLEPPQLEKLATGAAIHSDRDSVWAKMPVELVGLQVTQWKVHQGQADVSVTTPGYVIMATSPRWGEGGEKDGIWDKELTTEKDLLDDGWVRYTSIEEVTDDPENPFLWPVFVKQFEGGEKLEIRTEKYLAPRFFFPLVVTPKAETGSISRPGDTEIAAAKTEIESLFELEYERANDLDGLEKLKALKQVSKSIAEIITEESNEATVFALYQISINMGKLSCDAKFTIDLVDRFSDRYDEDVTQMRLELFDYWKKQIPDYFVEEEQLIIFRDLANLFRPYVESLQKEENFAGAAKYAELAAKTYTSAGDKEYALEMRRIATRMKAHLRGLIEIEELLNQLKLDPQQPEKNLLVGQYYCFDIENWGKGLPYLVNCGDEDLESVSASEIGPDGKEREELGDQWWRLSNQAKYQKYKLSMQHRAVHCYVLAKSRLEGLAKIDLQKKLEKIGYWGDVIEGGSATRIAKQPRPTLSPFDQTEAQDFQKSWAEFLKTDVSVKNAIGMDLVLIPPGTFMMGSPETEAGRVDSRELYTNAGGAKIPVGDLHEKQHQVKLTQPFQISMHEITQSQYEQVMNTNPSRWKGGNRPVENIGPIVGAAKEFCRRLSNLPAEKAAGRVYRLPTEAEWEYACRAGTITAYHFGDDVVSLGDYAWIESNAGGRNRGTHDVGGKKPNQWGLHDMLGNLGELVWDAYAPYPSGAVVDPKGLPVSIELNQRNRTTEDFENGWQIYRGGSCLINYNRSAERFIWKSDTQLDHRHVGFRVIAELRAIEPITVR